jgi:hypothetical protein
MTTQTKIHKKQQNKQWKQNKKNFRLLTLKHDSLKICISLRGALAVETHLAEGQWPEEQVNMLKLSVFLGRNPKADYLVDRWATFGATKNKAPK